MARNSRIWVAESNREICEAITKVNAKFDQPKIFFVKTPVTEETCYATKNSLLWQTDGDNLPNDEMYNERKIECGKAFDELKFHDYGKFTNRCARKWVRTSEHRSAKALPKLKRSFKTIFITCPCILGLKYLDCVRGCMITSSAAINTLKSMFILEN